MLVQLALGQKRLAISLFDSQCFQLIEYTRLTAKYYELMFICITTIHNHIHLFYISNLYRFAETLSYTKETILSQCI
jgi:hypothetical protein